MVEQEIEAAIVRRIEALGLEDVAVVGLWSPVAAGVVKGEEGRERAAVAVRVAPKEFTNFGICEVSMDVRITLTVRLDLCPTGEELVAIWQGLASIMEDWNMVQSGDELTDFAVGGFLPGGVQVVGGDGPSLEGRAWTVTQNLVLRGTVPHGE